MDPVETILALVTLGLAVGSLIALTAFTPFIFPKFQIKGTPGSRLHFASLTPRIALANAIVATILNVVYISVAYVNDDMTGVATLPTELVTLFYAGEGFLTLAITLFPLIERARVVDILTLRTANVYLALSAVTAVLSVVSAVLGQVFPILASCQVIGLMWYYVLDITLSVKILLAALKIKAAGMEHRGMTSGMPENTTTPFATPGPAPAPAIVTGTATVTATTATTAAAAAAVDVIKSTHSNLKILVAATVTVDLISIGFYTGSTLYAQLRVVLTGVATALTAMNVVLSAQFLRLLIDLMSNTGTGSRQRDN